MERGILTGLAAFRWVAWAWMATVLLVSRGELARPWLGVVLVGLALAVTVSLTALLRTSPLSLTRRPPLVAELTVGAALILGDGWAYGSGHAFATSQSLGVAWPLAGVLAAGAVLGTSVGTIAGAGMGLARVGSTLANGVLVSQLDGPRVLSLASSVVLFAMAGGITGYVVGLLRSSERQLSAAREREEIARHLHDGVLQTLAVVERRAEDPGLVRLAREQQRELREYLRDLRGRSSSLAEALRRAATRYESQFGGRAEVVVAEDVEPLATERLDALVGAVGEALSNVGKHADAAAVTIFAEPAEPPDLVFCSVKDDGPGFDTASTAEGSGLSHSIRDRVVEVGGRVEIDSRPGAGTEVRMWVP